MQRFRIALASIFLFSALAVLTCPGQQPAASSLPKNELIVPNVNGVFIPSVRDAPFSATVEVTSEQKLSDGSVNVLKTINHIARDSRGRTYNEGRRFVAPAFPNEPPIQGIHIYDPDAGFSTNLNPYTFVAQRTVMITPPTPRGDAVPSSSTSASNPLMKNEDLGTQTFEDLTVTGVRQSQGTGAIDEYWYSPELSIYVVRKHEDSKWKQTIVVAHIDRGEPDASKFVVPSGYKVVDGSTTSQSPEVPGQPGLYRLGGQVTAPQVIHAGDPQYTDEARKAKLGGICVVSVTVDSKGMPQNVHVVRPLGKGLDEKAIQAVQQYRFKPAMYQGHPVAVEVNIEVNFRIY